MIDLSKPTSGRTPIIGVLSLILSVAGALLVFFEFLSSLLGTMVSPTLDVITNWCRFFGILLAVVGLLRRERYWGIALVALIIALLATLFYESVLIVIAPH